MSIGFSFTGKVKGPKALIETARELAERGNYRLAVQEDGLRLALCPLGGDLYVNWNKDSGLFGQWAVEGSCRSTPAGPGLHRAAVDALDELGIRDLTVEDETGYYDHRDFERMCREHFCPWLTTIVSVCEQKKDEISHMCICWDQDQYMPEDIPGTVITPMGRFSLRWMRDTLEREGVEALAERLLLWYHPGKWDALFYRNLALNQLWESCYFVPSAHSEQDADLNSAICANLERAARLDPALPLPRAAYGEVCALAGRRPALPDGPALELEFQPGYRKGLVTYAIGPLRLTLPGVYRFEWEQWDETSGCHKWWDDRSDSPIWRVNGYKLKQGCAAFTPVLQGDNDLTEFEIRGGAVRHGWRELEEDGQTYYQVRAEVITGPSLFVITVSHRAPEERPGIVELMGKITANTQGVEDHTVPVKR